LSENFFCIFVFVVSKFKGLIYFRLSFDWILLFCFLDFIVEYRVEIFFRLIPFVTMDVWVFLFYFFYFFFFRAS
jgi:hypothetical protein